MKRALLILVISLLCGCRYAGNMQIKMRECQHVNIHLEGTEQTTEQAAGKEVMRGATGEVDLAP